MRSGGGYRHPKGTLYLLHHDRKDGYPDCQGHYGNGLPPVHGKEHVGVSSAVHELPTFEL